MKPCVEKLKKPVILGMFLCWKRHVLATHFPTSPKSMRKNLNAIFRGKARPNQYQNDLCRIWIIVCSSRWSSNVYAQGKWSVSPHFWPRYLTRSRWPPMVCIRLIFPVSGQTKFVHYSLERKFMYVQNRQRNNNLKSCLVPEKPLGTTLHMHWFDARAYSSLYTAHFWSQKMVLNTEMNMLSECYTVEIGNRVFEF